MMIANPAEKAVEKPVVVVDQYAFHYLKAGLHDVIRREFSKELSMFPRMSTSHPGILYRRFATDSANAYYPIQKILEDHVVDKLSHAGYSEEEVKNVDLVANELYINACFHGNEGGEDLLYRQRNKTPDKSILEANRKKRILVDFLYSPDYVLLRFSDCGGKDAVAVMERHAEEERKREADPLAYILQEEHAKSGKGLTFIKALSDDFVMYNNPNGITASAIKYLKKEDKGKILTFQKFVS